MPRQMMLVQLRTLKQLKKDGFRRDGRGQDLDSRIAELESALNS